MSEMWTAGGSCRRCSRRNLLRTGIGVAATGIALGAPVREAALADSSSVPGGTGSGGTSLPNPLPTPIPELDAFGHHNVPAAPYSEPSQIFDFKGRVAEAVLAGTGHDQHGNLIKIGGPGTDLRFMQGEYVTADGAHHQGTFLRI
jgi:hypothetical protein